MRWQSISAAYLALALLLSAFVTAPPPAIAAQQRAYATVEQLAGEVLRRLRADPRFVDVTPNPDDAAQLYVHRANGVGGQVRIDVTNLLGKMGGLSPAEAERAIRQLIDVAAAGSERQPLDTARIFANVRPRGYLHQDGQDLSDILVHTDLAGDLIVLYQIDEQQALRALNWAEVGGHSLDELAELARRNLDSQLGSLTEQQIGEQASVFTIEDNPFLTPALLLSDRFHSYVAGRFPDGYMIGVPGRDFVLVFGKKDPKALQLARSVVDMFIRQGQDFSSPLLFERRDGRLAVVDERPSN